MKKVLVAMTMMVALLMATTAMAEEVTVKYTGTQTSGTATIWVDGASQGTVYVAPMNLVINGVAGFTGFCVDLYHHIYKNVTYKAILEPAPTTWNWCKMGNILQDFDWTTLNNTSGAALQLAIWKLTYPDQTVKSSNATYNAAAASLIEGASSVCPSCTDVELLVDVQANMFGQLEVVATLLSASVPMEGERIELSTDSGAFVGDAFGITDGEGKVTGIIELGGDPLPVSITAEFNGYWIQRLIPQGVNYQELQSLMFGDLCLVQSDPGLFDETPMGDPRTIGFWKHQVKIATGGKGKAQVPADVLASFFPITVFDVTVNDAQEAYDLLWLKKATMEQRAVQQCLATLLNKADGQLDWYTDLDLDGDGIGDGWFWEFFLAADTAYYGNDFETAKTLCDDINNL
jgi:hypothetical protein